MANQIDTQTKRMRLKPRREAYWARIQAGCFVGFRRSSFNDNGGTWLARYRDPETSKQHWRPLELPAHLPPGAYDAAVKEARKWFESLEAGAKPKGGTVEEAAENYLKYIGVKKGERTKADAEGRIRRYIKPTFGALQVDKLTTAKINNWLHDFVPKKGTAEQIRKAKVSANRNLAALKAILNYAHRNGLATSTAAWDRVESFKKVDGTRDVFLDEKQLKRLLDNCEGHFKDLVISGALTGARYGELCALRVKDLDTDANVLNIREGKTGPRIVPLTADMLRHFKRLAKDKLPEAPLLTRDGSNPWRHSDQDELFRDAAAKAKLPPGSVFYSLRHAFIASAIVAGADIFTVSKVTGTSVLMIQKTYGKLLQDVAREAMTRAMTISIQA